MTADPLDKIRGQLLVGIAKETGRQLRRRVRLTAAAVVVILGAAGLVLAAPWQDDPHDAVVAGEGTTDGSTVPGDAISWTEGPDGTIWSIEQPPAWDRAGRELMPNLGSDSLTLASFELRAGGERCAQFPEHAMRDMGARDALVSIWFGGPSSDELPAWPDEGLPEAGLLQLGDHDSLVCAERDDLAVHWGTLDHTGVGIEVLVAFGPDVPTDVVATSWSALSSLRPRDDVDAAQVPACVVTVTAVDTPELPTPPGYDTPPGSGFDWYGTPDLWTWLPSDGRHSQRKSLWLSEHYPGGDVEPEPAITTTWQRLDDPTAESAEGGPAGAPAHGTATDPGGPIIAGIDPLEAGCWEVTATYKGHELSYVYWHPSVTVPDVVGVQVGVAETELTRAGYLLGRVNDFDAPLDFALVIAQEPPPGSTAPVGAPVGLRTAVPDPPEQQECPGTAHPRDPVTADALPNVEAVTRRSAAEAWASLPGREVDGVPTYLGKWDRQAWQRTDGGAVEIVPVDGYQLVVVHESVDDCPDGPPSSTNGVPITHWVLPDDAGE